MSAIEINFDGLVGPTHNYAGLSEGNLASQKNKDQIARPRSAALQGLAKMRTLMAMGLTQGVFAPQERPPSGFLRALGFVGDDKMMWEACWRSDNEIARNALAASAMWAANAATVSASADCADGRVHFTPANLHTMLHRALEAPATHRLLQRMFADAKHFCVHPPLPAHGAFADEGAANFMRLAATHGAPGVEALVYGRRFSAHARHGHPARQTREACAAIFRSHVVTRAIYAQQSAVAIDAGAFHNDVVAVANERVLFHHQLAFANTAQLHEDLARAGDGLFSPIFLEVSDADVPLADAISSYLFNAQLLSIPGQARMVLVAPAECAETPSIARYLESIVAGNGPIGRIEIVDVRESMRNGGGPACLRLRVVVTEDERAAIAPGFLLTPTLTDQLEAWVRAHYRETLAPRDLADPQLLEETRAALDALTRILPLGSDFYAFQRAGA
jgi:succinylarginine dihydrolase